MRQIARHAEEIISSGIGDTVNPAVTALMATAAVVTHRPELAAVSIPVGAFAGAVTQQGLLLIGQAWNDRAERVRQFAEAVTSQTGQPIEDFVAEHVDDEAKRELLGRLVETTTDTRSAWKIRMLARAFVKGAMDGERVDIILMVVDLLRKVDPVHARLLAAFDPTPGGVAVNPGEPLDVLLERDPGITAAAPFVVRHVVELDLVRVNEGSSHPGALMLTDLGELCRTWLRNLAEDDPPSG
jgi:hypothetical protein